MDEVEQPPMELIEPRVAPRLRVRVLSRPLTARGALTALSVIAVLSIAIRVVLAREVRGPFFFMDELGYEQMSASLARSGHFALFGKTGTAYAPLYSLVLAPIYALTSNALHAYEWAKVVNAVSMSLAVFPIYGIARFVLSRPKAVGVAALSLIAPLMFYADLELSENLAYPLTLLAIWAMLRAVREPRPRNDAILLAAIALACAARLQQVALFPAALTATLLVALVRPEGGRARELRCAVRQHRLLFGTVVVGLAAVLARTVQNGGALPFAGRYSIVSKAHPSVVDVLHQAVQHLAAFDFAIGIVPFAGALLAAYALARFGFPRNALVFGAVAAATTAWLLIVVAWDAAAFDRSYVQRIGQQIPTDASRIHERYLIYLVPLFLIAMVAGLRAARPRVSWHVHLVVAAVAALLPLAIPFSTGINDTSVAESFGLQTLAKNVQGTILPWGHAVQIALYVGVVLALGFFYAVARPRPTFAVVLTVFAFLIFSSVARVRIIGAAQTIADTSAHARWVDRAVGGGQVTLVGGTGAQQGALLETAFDNLSVRRLYYVCTPAFEADFGEQQATLDPAGRLRGTDGLIHARYAVVPADFGVPGRILGAWNKGGILLVAPTGGVIRIPRDSLPAAVCPPA
jgi:hypothetical protein